MEKKKLHAMRSCALVMSLLPLVTLIPAILKITLPDGIRMAFCIINIICIVTGFVLSVICIKHSESKHPVTIISAVISAFLLFVMSGMIILALFFAFGGR